MQHGTELLCTVNELSGSSPDIADVMNEAVPAGYVYTKVTDICVAITVWSSEQAIKPTQETG